MRKRTKSSQNPAIVPDVLPTISSDLPPTEEQDVPSTEAEAGTSLTAMAETPQHRFPIIGIGASAGGLEALELFLRHVPSDSGMAFVIVQHLDPTRQGVMAELLQHHTSMPVTQISDRTRVEPNHVYIIPSNKDLSILRGVLHLLAPVAPRGQRLPIDFFFRALADDQQERSIGVILSGMASDGTLGLRSIKEKAGAIFVQDPASAKFDGMPRSAIESGLADVIAPVEELPARIRDYLNHMPFTSNAQIANQSLTQSAFEKIIIILRSQTGNDFSLYKKTTMSRRIERRMGLHQIVKINDYVRFLQENHTEVELLFHELLIGVTSFFRDPAVWELLKSKVLPEVVARQSSNHVIRAWVAACSTGEEAYSLAILFKESLEELNITNAINLQIFATDLEARAIDIAREGLFPASIAAEMSEQRLERFFVKVDHGYQVVKSIREMIIFATQNILMDPPFTKLDLLSCRNLLIYLTPESQKKLLPLMHYCLRPNGILLLGSAETVGSYTNLFSQLASKIRVYERIDGTVATGPIELPHAFIAAHSSMPVKMEVPSSSMQTLADQLILQTYAPAAVLTNDSGDLLYISGRTGKYLEPAAGKVNWNIFAMARDGLRYELTTGFQKALRQREIVTLEQIVIGSNGEQNTVNVTIHPLRGPDALHGMVMIVFTDLPTKAKHRRSSKHRPEYLQLIELEQELERARHNVQSLREEMQTSQEELKATNEELQSTNEELQSTNEELTTSKEELQSMNEELHTVNQELQTKFDEVSRANNDMKNLLNSTDIATLFLDNNLYVRRFTSETSKIINLIPTDIGRPITDIASALLYPELTDDVHEVLRALVKVERQLPAPNGEYFAVRILPYRTIENKIDGVVITFTNITAYKLLEAEQRRTEARLRGLLHP